MAKKTTKIKLEIVEESDLEEIKGGSVLTIPIVVQPVTTQPVFPPSRIELPYIHPAKE